MKSATRYIQDLQAKGRLHFTTEDAARELGTSAVATRAAIRRLKEKSMLATPHRGFHVIVPPRYRELGCLPAEQFISELMEYLEAPYYVGLLSAAVYYGAAHQRPMVFQVVVSQARRPIRCGPVVVEFIARSDMEDTPVQVRNTETGFIRIASPEATAFELVGYPDRSGQLSNVATVLSELREAIVGERLAREADRAPSAWVQRLGFLLCQIGADDLASHLDAVLASRKVYYVALAPWEEMAGAQRDPRWRVAMNVDVDPDL